MSLPTAFLLLLSMAAAPATVEGGGWVKVASSLVKLRPGDGAFVDRPLALDAARGECEGAQLWILPPRRRVRLEAGMLGLGKARIPFQAFKEGYLEVRRPSNLDGAPGLWPDALIPLRDTDGAPLPRVTPADSTPERPLIFYLLACVPPDAPAGVYRTEVRVEAEGTPPVRLPFSLRVEPFAIPATSSLPNTFGISLYAIARGHGLPAESPQAHQLLHDYAAMMLAHRLSAFGMGIEAPPTRIQGGRAQVDFSPYDREMGPFLDGSALPSHARFTTAELREDPKLRTDEERVLYYRAFREHFTQKGWPQTLFYYAKDEPGPKDFPTVLGQSRRVRAAGGIPVLVTSWSDPALRDATDIFCPVLNCFFPRPGPQTCKEVASAAELRARIPPRAQVWWYQSCMSHGCGDQPLPGALAAAYQGWASYMVDAPLPLNRAMGPLAYLSGIGGELYYDVVLAYDDRDPWMNQYEFGGNGDGTLFYPGTPARLGSLGHLPVGSLRLEAIRDGLEDYEYLRALDAAGEGAFARAEARKLARSGYEITRDPAVWETARAQMQSVLRHLATRKLPREAR